MVLHDLYTLVDTCNDNKNTTFNPVLLKIKNEVFLKEMTAKDGAVYPFLLQIWDNEGVMVFERRLLKQQAQWAISGHIFLLRENNDADELILVKLTSKEPATVFTVELPFSELAKRNKADA